VEGVPEDASWDEGKYYRGFPKIWAGKNYQIYPRTPVYKAVRASNGKPFTLTTTHIRFTTMLQQTDACGLILGDF